MSEELETIRSRIWEEEAEGDNPFAAAACYCAGFDVYGDLLGKISWPEYLLLMFQGEPPAAAGARLLERLAVALANPGPRDPAVHAAMCGGVGGSHAAASLMGALAVGAGQLGGGREVFLAMTCHETCGEALERWRELLPAWGRGGRIDAWPEPEHPPGFDPNGVSCPTPVRQTLDRLVECGAGTRLEWLRANREALEAIADAPLSLSGVAAAALADLGLSPEQGEMLYLLLRLPGAAVHTLEQRRYGWRKFPFWPRGIELTDDPGPYEGEPGGQIPEEARP